MIEFRESFLLGEFGYLENFTGGFRQGGIRKARGGAQVLRASQASQEVIPIRVATIICTNNRSKIYLDFLLRFNFSYPSEDGRKNEKPVGLRHLVRRPCLVRRSCIQR